MKRWALIEGIQGVLVAAPGSTTRAFLGQEKVRPESPDPLTGLADWHRPIKQVVQLTPDIKRAAQRGGVQLLGVLTAQDKPTAEAFSPAGAEHGAAPRKVK